MGPNEVQALIGQWVDLVGNGRDRDKDRERRERDRRGSNGSQPPSSWGQQPPYQQPPYQQPPYQPAPPYQPPPYQEPPYFPYQAAPSGPAYAPYPYQAPLAASDYRQPLPPYQIPPSATVSPASSSVTVTRDYRRPWSTTTRDHRGFWDRAAHKLMPWVGAEADLGPSGPEMGPPALEVAPFPPRAAVVDAPLPTQANRDILPMSTSVPILPTQSAQITGRPQTLVFKIGRFVISNAGTAGGSADWIVNDIKIGNVSQFVQSGDVPGDMFATNAIDTFVRFATAQTAMDVVVVVTYIGLNESGCPFFGAMVGTAAV